MSEPKEGPTIQIPLDEWTKELIKATIQEHVNSCPVRARVDKLELRIGTMVGFMVGSGIFGGTAGALVAKLLSI